VALILGIGAAAAAALALWKLLRRRGEPWANVQVNEARRAAGLVNAVAFAATVVLDALVLRRSPSQYTPNALPSAPGRAPVNVPARIGDTE
jgi:hypothetical protein